MYAIKAKKGKKEWLVCYLPLCKTKIEAENLPEFVYMRNVYKCVEIVEVK